MSRPAVFGKPREPSGGWVRLPRRTRAFLPGLGERKVWEFRRRTREGMILPRAYGFRYQTTKEPPAL